MSDQSPKPIPATHRELVGLIPLLIGACWTLSILVSDLGVSTISGEFARVDQAGYTVLGRGLIWLALALTFAAGAIASRDTRRWETGLLAGGRAGLIGGFIGLLGILAIRAVFAKWLDQSGYPLQFSVSDGFKAGVWHVIFGGLSGAVLGTAGSLVVLVRRASGVSAPAGAGDTGPAQ